MWFGPFSAVYHRTPSLDVAKRLETGVGVGHLDPGIHHRWLARRGILFRFYGPDKPLFENES